MDFTTACGDIWPLTGAKPGVEGVVVSEVFFTAYFDFFFVDTSVKNPVGWIFGVFEGWDWDAPRNLSRDIPVADVLEIVDKSFFLAGWMEFDFILIENLDGTLGKWLNIDEPLLFEKWFDNGVAFVTVTNGVSYILFPAKIAVVVEIVEDFLATFFGGKAFVVGACFVVHAAIKTDNGNHLEIVALSNLVIVWIVRWGNFDGAGTVTHIGMLVGNNRNFTVGKR